MKKIKKAAKAAKPQANLIKQIVDAHLSAVSGSDFEFMNKPSSPRCCTNGHPCASW